MNRRDTRDKEQSSHYDLRKILIANTGERYFQFAKYTEIKQSRDQYNSKEKDDERTGKRDILRAEKYRALIAISATHRPLSPIEKAAIY